MKQVFKKGKNVAYEIERRYLVLEMSGRGPVGKSRIKKSNIKQGYFETELLDKSFRVRIIDNKRAVITLKSGKGLIRKEEEFNIDLKLARKLYSLCQSHLEKVRYYDDRWEVDFFKGPLKGVVLIEVELKHVNEKVKLPVWIKKSVEVTDSLNNHHLARLVTVIKNSGVSPLSLVLSHVQNPIPKIVITGGPCTGKSSFIESFKESNPDIHCVPEVASIIIGQLGIRPPKDIMANRDFQRFVHKVQSIFEATSIQYAVSEGKRAVLLDRGKVDGAGYLKGGVREYIKILNTDIKAEYSHYDLVICLGIPSRKIFEQKRKNNPNRSENYAAARRLSEKIRRAWQGHPNFTFIPSTGSWEKKVQLIKEAIDREIA